MKKKILFLTLTLSIVLISCNDKSINCNGELEKETLKAIFKEGLNNIKLAFVMNGVENPENSIEQFINENIKIDLVRTTEINKELKSCNCAAELKVQLSPNIKNQINSGLPSSMYEKKISIEYLIQETDNGEFIVETNDISEELGKFVFLYYTLEKQYKKDKLVIEKDKIYKYQSGTEDCSYDLWFIISPRNDEVKGEYIQKCYFDEEPSSYKFTGIFKNGRIIGDIDKKEFFELSFNNSEMQYSLKKTILDNGEIITYDDDSPLIYTLKE